MPEALIRMKTLHTSVPVAATSEATAGGWSAATAAAYWERRAQQFAQHGRGLAAVCSYGMPAFYNTYIEHCQRRALLPWLDRLARQPGRRALDVGCGVGRWSLQLAMRGYEVTGIDVSPSMVGQARRNVAQQGTRCAFAVGDLNTLQLDARFDLILSVTVLQHVLDATQAMQAVARLAAHLAPGGRLILLEAAPTRAHVACDTAVFCARTLQWHRQALARAGLSVQAECGVDPMPFKTWLLPRYRRLPRTLGLAALLGVTLISWPLDRWLAPVLQSRSWHKLLVAGAA